MTRLTVILLFALLTVTHTYAQEIQPPVLDANEILTDQVEVVATLPVLEFDYDQDLLYYHDEQNPEWLILPLPYDSNSRPTALRRSDGTYLFGTSNRESLERQPTSEFSQVWLFDPAAQTITLPSFTCSVVTALPGEGRWVLSTPDDVTYQFCFTETGETSPALEEPIEDLFCHHDYDDMGRYQTALSPEGDYVVAAICSQTDIVSVYAYHIPQNEVRLLGSITDTATLSENAISLGEWADNTHPMLKWQQPTGLSNRFERLPREYLLVQTIGLYTADLAQANSLEMQVEVPYLLMQNGAIRHEDAANRFLWIPAEINPDEYPVSAENCQIHVLAAATLAVEVVPHPVENGCSLGMAVNDGSGDRFYVDQTNKRLLRFNLDQGSAATVYEGEISQIVSLSPDHRYAEIAVGDVMDVAQQNSMSGFSANEIEGAHMAIIDLATGDILTRAPFYISDPMVAPLLAPSLNWIGEDGFSLRGGTVYESSWGKIVDGDLEWSMVPASSEDNSLALAQFYGRRDLILNPDADHALGLFDPALGEVIPLVKTLSDDYRVYGRLLEDGSIAITITLWNGGYTFELGKWTVKV